MKKRVILIRNAAASDFGGAERVPVFTAKELAQHDMDPIVFSHSKKLLNFAKQENVKHLKSWWWSRQDWSGWRVILFPIYILWQVILFFYYLTLFIYWRPSVVSPQSKDDFIAATFAARVLGIKVFWTDHGDLKFIWMNHGIWYKNPVGKLIYLASYATPLIITTSKNEKGLLSTNVKGDRIMDKIKITYIGVVDAYQQANKSIDFISAARLVSDKGIGELIEAFAKIVEKHPAATLAIIGDGPERNKFKKQAKNITGITFYGHQSKPLEFLERSRIFVLPTHHEAFGVAVVEACMEGLAIIASDIGGIPEIVKDKKSALLVPIKDPVSLFEAMDKLYTDKELQQSLGKAARQRFLSDFELSGVIEKYYLPLYEGKL